MHTLPQLKLTKVALAIFLSCALNAWATPPQGKAPPPEAIEACEGKSEGEAVTFETRHGHTLSATCQTIENQLAAVPEKHRRKAKE